MGERIGVHTRLPVALHRQAEAAAQLRGVPLSEFLVAAVEREVASVRRDVAGGGSAGLVGRLGAGGR